MAVIETIFDLLNHTDKKGFSVVHILFIKTKYLRLRERIDAVAMDLKGISHANGCIQA